MFTTFLTDDIICCLAGWLVCSPYLNSAELRPSHIYHFGISHNKLNSPARRCKIVSGNKIGSHQINILAIA